jgi:hypothetical protein
VDLGRSFGPEVLGSGDFWPLTVVKARATPKLVKNIATNFTTQVTLVFFVRN